MRRAAVPFGVVLFSLAACHPSTSGRDFTLRTACPRDARPDASGRCACEAGDVLVLGACVSPSVADAYCGPSARAGDSGACAYPSCSGDDAVDVEGGCVPLHGLLHGGPRSCPSGAMLVVEERRLVCISGDAACPRGSRLEGPTCAHPPQCPAGSLPTAGSCRPVVLQGGQGGPLVDLGAWAAVVLGVDGGPGSPELCRPLEAHPLAFGLAPGESLPLRLRIAVSAPDDDVTRVSAEVRAASADSAHLLPPAATDLSSRAVASLLEPLRGLGGDATAARVDVEVRCRVTSP
jgi:hypothetical protein